MAFLVKTLEDRLSLKIGSLVLEVEALSVELEEARQTIATLKKEADQNAEAIGESISGREISKARD